MAGFNRVHDLVLDGVGFLVVGTEQGKPKWAVTPIPAEMGQTASIAEVPVSMRTWHAGFGYGESYVPGAYHYADNLDARWPGVLVMAPLVTTITLTADGTNRVSDIFEHTVSGTSYLYALHGKYCSRINTSTDAEVAIPGTPGTDGANLGAVVATRAVNFQTSTFVGFTGSTKIYELDSSGAWTQATDAVAAQYWCKDWDDRTATHRLWRAYSTNSMSSCAAGDSPRTAANWAATWTVGDTSHAITDLIAADSQLMIAKTNGLYTADHTTRNRNITEQAAFLVDSANGARTVYDGAYVYYPHLMGLLGYERASNSVSSMHPGAATSNHSPVRGTVTAQAIGGPWHYLALYNGTDTYILAGRFPTEGEAMPPGWVGPKIWHTLLTLSGVQCDAMLFIGITSPPRLYFGHGTNLAYIRVPKSGNVIAEIDTGNLTFAASGSFYFSPTDFDQPGEPKELTGFELENTGFSASTYAVLYARLDGGGWQMLERAQVAGRSSLRIPSGNWRGHRVEYRLDLVNAASASTPRIKACVGKAAYRPVIRDLITTTVYCEDGRLLRNGRTENAKGQDLLQHLKDLQEAGAITASDWWTGAERFRQVMVHKVQETVIEQEKNQPAAYGAEVQFSVLRDIPTPWNYDSGTLWDSGAKWG